MKTPSRLHACVVAAGLLLAGSPAWAQNGAISGRVTSQATGLPLAGITVWGCSSPTGCSSGMTNASGNYLISRPPGAHSLYTQGPDTLVHEVYNDGSVDIPCAGPCPSSPSTGAIVLVQSNVTSSLRDFSLAPAARVSGRVTDAATGAGLAGVSVTVASEGGSQLSGFVSASTDATGAYAIGGLPAGRYAAWTYNTAGYVDELPGDAQCVGLCSGMPLPLPGGRLDLVAGGTATADFVLSRGGRIEGRVFDEVTGQATGPGVIAYASVAGRAVRAGFANPSAGAYAISGLPSGTYYVAVFGQQVFRTDEIYDNVPRMCLGACEEEDVIRYGRPVTVTAGAATSGVDFGLRVEGLISGTVRDAGTLMPVTSGTVRVYRREGDTFWWVRGVAIVGAGVYSSGVPGPGTYYLLAGRFGDTLPISIPCGATCDPAAAGLTGPVEVSLGQSVTRDLTLPTTVGTARLSGTVRDVIGSPLNQMAVTAYRASGATAVVAGRATTTPQGTYSIAGLPAGTYYLLAGDGRDTPQFISEVWAGVLGTHCPGCTPDDVRAQGDAIAVEAGADVTGRDFQLEQGSSIRGRVTGPGGVPLRGIAVNVYSSEFPTRALLSAVTDGNGRYTIRALSRSPYRVSTAGPSQWLHEIRSNIPCVDGVCTAAATLAQGAALSMANGTQANDVDFALDPLQAPPLAPVALSAAAQAFGVRITWAPSPDGAAATSYVLEAGVSPGTTAATVPAGETSLFVPGVPPGVYYLRVRGVNAFGTGPASAEVVLAIGAAGNSAPLPPIDAFAWMGGSRLAMTWAAPAAGVAPTSYVVEAGTVPGVANIASLEVSTTSFVYEPVPPGVYFLRVRSRAAGLLSAAAAEQMVVVGGVPAPPAAPRTLTASMTGTTATITWTPPSVGAVTSYVLEAGSAPGLANIAALDTGSTAPQLVVPGVPPGVYHLRVRGRNAQGVGLASNEFVLAVP